MITLLLKALPLQFLLVLPLVEIGGVTFFLRGMLSRPWLFAISSVVVIYLLLGILAYRDLSGVGITGAPSAQPADAPVGSLAGIGVGATYTFLVLVAVWGMSYFFRHGS
jgi:hypothetical protein